MSFPLGKPVLVMLVAATLSGTAVFFHKVAAKTDLTFWTFAIDRGFELDPSILKSYQARTGLKVGVTVLRARALDTRLLSLFMKSGRDAQSPDVVEVEIGSVGKFFRPPVKDIGFLPWNDYLDRTNLRTKFSAARLAVWSKEGQIFGLPQDMHPVSLTYRKDLYDIARVDPARARTWGELQQACLDFEQYWRAHGQPRRHAMELLSHSSDDLEIMLQQRHINLLNAENQLFLDDPKVAQTLAFYTGLVAGPGQIAGDANPGEKRWSNDVSKGDLCMLLTPDWRASELRQNAPDLKSKLAMMPLPRFDPDDAPTASYGGTMIAIPRQCAHPEEARAFAVFLTTSLENIKANRLAGFDLIPPLPEQWSDPIYHQPDPFYAGDQSVDDLYVQLARQLPPHYVTPFTAVASIELSGVISSAVEYRRHHGEDGLIEKCRRLLDEAATDLESRIRFGTFSN